MEKLEEAVRGIKVLANSIESRLSFTRAEGWGMLIEEDRQDILADANAIQTEVEKILREMQK